MKKLFVFLLVLPLLSFTLHKYYVALTEIEYREDTQSVQMIMNVFMDDIELAINKDYNTNLQIATKNELPSINEYYYKYLKTHFKVTINNKEAVYKFIGKEYDGNIVYFYLEIENVSLPKSIKIENDILVDHFPDQQNLIKATVKKERKSLFLSSDNDKGLLNFK
ncbi:hypothetical protein Q4517_12405 [Tenacibaculum sp. 1_MG-2023]|uniref:DUF6702 family protein n=1 Tax=Tenacibaculum sp. 1_MG-2023 TaxID=3062653 RepID=UPI0026E27080|nr:DUF6702 family protein [Tenacibaculum sp. 1_MG-2023]MDO6676346.1 hypothetical protein [Tenacibaculum sp. 1_MG-2023]